jgi:hypothetical protein
MWCDDFDADLLKVIPYAAQILAPARDIKLVTRGGTTDGMLNHPACWNGYNGPVAFFGTVGMPESEWRPESNVTSEKIVECTAEEALRDWWPHGFLMNVNHVAVTPTNKEYNSVFGAILSHTRGWQKQTDGDIQTLIFTVRNILADAVGRIQRIEEIGRARLMTLAL